VNPQRISFARTLPILALLLSYVIIAVPATMAYINLRSASSHGSDVIVRYHKDPFSVSHLHFLRPSLESGAALTSRTIVATNFAGGSIEFAVQKAAGTWPHGWAPFGISVTTWKAIAFPIYCLPFWWLVGLGMDATFHQRQLRWWALLPGSLLWAFSLLVAVGLIFNVLAAKDRFPLALECGVCLWFILLSVFPFNWIKMELATRRIKARLHSRLAAETQ